MTPDLERLLPTLVRVEVKFIVVGRVAAIVHGSARATYDIDLVYSRDGENIRRLVNSLAPHKPYLREAPPGLLFAWDAKTIRHGLNFTLTTKLGDIDLFGELAGGETYEDLLAHSFDVEAFGVCFRCIDLPTLIRIKETAGRSKDRDAIAELRVCWKRPRRSNSKRALVFSATRVF